MILSPPRPTLFPYTTLFRSAGECRHQRSAEVSGADDPWHGRLGGLDRKSTRLNSSHVAISYAVFCMKKKDSQTRESHPVKATKTEVAIDKLSFSLNTLTLSV